MVGQHHRLNGHESEQTLGDRSFPGGSDSKESACNAETLVQFLGREDPLEKGMATHSSILAWRIPWREDTGGLQSMGLQNLDTTE